MCRAMDTFLKTLPSTIITTSHQEEHDRVANGPIKFTIVQDNMLNASTTMVSSLKNASSKKTSRRVVVVLPSSCQQRVEEKQQQQQQVRFKDHIQCRWSLDSDNDRLPRVARRSQSFSRTSF